MKNLIVIMCLLTSALAFGQTKMYTKTGVVEFEASVPSFEEVKAKNENVTAVLQTDTGNLAALVLIKGFRFKNALMEEHFNENYMDSDKYPKATFKGALENFDAASLSATPKEIAGKGTITIHGVSKEVAFTMETKTTAGGIHLSTELLLSPADFNIDIPGIVKEKIAKEISMRLSFEVASK